MKPRLLIHRPDKKTTDRIERLLNCSPVTATLLANRGLTGGPETRTFLEATLADIAPPATIRDLEKAVERIAAAVTGREKIMIFGDFDADGITATAILYNFLRQAGADAVCHIPHRIMEGYGLKPEQISRVAVAGEVSLIITVDCGSGSLEAARACQKAGIDLIITDHHQMSPPFPKALAIVNPCRPDCESGLTQLCGAGVAFYLLIALRARLRQEGFWTADRPEPNLKQYCDLVAIGTIADVVPLVGVNRILVQAGLEVINQAGRPGLEALLTAAKINQRPVTAEDIAYKVAPRINAAGRIDHGRAALDLLIADDPQIIQKTAARLCRLNTRRQFLEEEITAEIFQVLNSQPDRAAHRKMLVMAHHQWHQGVIGIAAARTARKYCLPVALITIQGDIGIGSARSIPGLDLYRALRDCADLLEDFGGHARAAGFKIKTENIPRLEQQLAYAIGLHSSPDQFTPLLEVDCELPFEAITDRLLNELERLQPFGEQNPEPRFLATNVNVASSFLIKNKYPKMVLTQSSSPAKKINAISFNLPPGENPPGHFRQILFRLRRETWNGRGTPQLIVEAASESRFEEINQGEDHGSV